MKKNKLLIAILSASVLTLGLTGCATPKKEEQAKSTILNNKIATTQALLKITPEWYLAPPVASGGEIYAVATATNADMQFALNRAILLGEQSIVKQLATEISSKETNNLTNSGGSNSVLSTEYIEAVIHEAGLFGHKVAKRQFFPDPKTGEFRVFVEMYLSDQAKANILTAAAKKDKTLADNKELKAEVKAIRAKYKKIDNTPKEDHTLIEY